MADIVEKRYIKIYTPRKKKWIVQNWCGPEPCFQKQRSSFGSLSSTALHDSLMSSRIANRKKRIIVGFELFFDKFEQIANLKSELASESCYTVLQQAKVKSIEMVLKTIKLEVKSRSSFICAKEFDRDSSWMYRIINYV